MKSAATLLLVFLFAACKTQNLVVEKKKDERFQHIVQDSAFTYEENYEYRVRKDDKISMSVWGHDDLSIGSLFGIYNSNEVYGKWVMVNNAGNITLPKIGDFNIMGLTLSEAKDSLKRIYGKWLVNPVIEVKVLNKEITVLGELRNPGKYIVDRDMNSVFDLVAMAGGFEEYASKTNIKVIRQWGKQVKMINVDLTIAGNYLNRNIQLHPGDVLVVPSKKSKDFDKRVATIIPFASSATAAAVLIKTFL